MNKLQIKIRNKVYTLRTDEDPARMTRIAENLDEKITEFAGSMHGRTEVEIITITAFDLMERVDDLLVSESKLADQSKKLNDGIQTLKELIEETEAENNKLLKENISSAGNELEQIAMVKEQENEKLRIKIQEYEKEWNDKASDVYNSAIEEIKRTAEIKEQENEALRIKIQRYEKEFDEQSSNVYQSAINVANEAAESKEAENQKLKETLENFEKLFDEFAKTKEGDILRMQEEIEALKLKLAETSEDGQMMLV